MPHLLAYSVEISVGAASFLCWINLRGMRGSVRVVALPLYVFILSLLSLCVYGFMENSLPHAPIVSTDWSMLDFAALLVILRAFSGGCTALTGIEAIANAGSLIKEPQVKNAQRLYLILALLIAVIFIGITVLTQQFQLTPRPHESLLSQLVRLLYGNGWVHTLIHVSTCIVLFLAANTAFADYPRLCAILARDGWLPSQLGALGDRLVFHKGIILLVVLAITFLVLFNADVHHLIPLYAIGVLTAFTLSQTGMMRYWLNYLCTNPHQKTFSVINTKVRATISGIGAVTTGLVLLIFFEAKFFEGAYLSLVVIPLLCLMCLKIQKHYQEVEKQMVVTEAQIKCHKRFAKTDRRLALVPISRPHLGSLEALSFAREMTSNVIAVLVDINSHNTQITKEFIESLGWGIQVVILKSPYRSVMVPLLEYLSSFENDSLIIFPEIVPKKWWQRFLHNETVLQMIKALEWRVPLSGQTRIIITVPYHLKK
jgi:amino acid transporter